MEKKILITTSSFDVDKSEALIKLKNMGFEFVTNPFKRKLNAQEISSLLKEHQPLGIIAGVEPLGREQLLLAQNLSVVSRCGTGLDTVDLYCAKELGIIVTNTPDAPTLSVAELAIGLILCCLRQIPRADRDLRDSKWRAIKGNLLSGKTVGIVGYGRIGRKLGELLRGFDVKVIANDPSLKLNGSTDGVLLIDFHQLLLQADIVSLHLPYADNTHHIIDKKCLSLMKKDSILINVSRGGLVDEIALYEALSSGHLSSAGFDVFENEPYAGPLITLPNIVLTCHMGSSAQETRRIMEEEAAENLLMGLSNTGYLIA